MHITDLPPLAAQPRLPRMPRVPLPPVRRWARVRRERRLLAGLSDHMLRDIGLSRAEVMREAARPFWDTAEGITPRDHEP